MESNIDISIVVPLYNEVESLPELHAWIQRVMKENNFSYEVLFVDDGSKDGSRLKVAEVHAVLLGDKSHGSDSSDDEDAYTMVWAISPE